MPSKLLKKTSLLPPSVFQPLQKNGQISSLTSLNGHSEDDTLAEGVCVCYCVSVPCVVAGAVPVIVWGSGGTVCVCLCLGSRTVSSVVAEGALVCVGSVFSVCVFKFLSPKLCRIYPTPN